MSNDKMIPYTDPEDIRCTKDGVSTINAVLRLRPVKEETSTTPSIEDLEAFLHRLLKAGLSYSDVSREGLNYAVSMMSPSLSAKESLEEASKLLEKATKNIGISSDQLIEERQRALYRHHEVK